MNGTYLTHEERRTRDAQIFRTFQDGSDLEQLVARFRLSRSNVCRIVKEQSWRTGEKLRKVKKPAHNRKREGPACQHCRENLASRPRGLCDTCYSIPEVRASYAVALGKYAPSEIADFNGAAKTPDTPTRNLPGSAGKKSDLAERALLGLSLWHPKDASPRRIARCLHERAEGECPKCERAARRLTGVKENDDGCEDD